jgi:hypothetical protein
LLFIRDLFAGLFHSSKVLVPIHYSKGRQPSTVTLSKLPIPSEQAAFPEDQKGIGVTFAFAFLETPISSHCGFCR